LTGGGGDKALAELRFERCGYFATEEVCNFCMGSIYFRKNECVSLLAGDWQNLQQQQLKKLGIFYMLPRPVQPLKESSYTKGQSQTASQSEPLERATLLPGLSPGYIWLLSHITVVL
jgi:hypothetical protein